MSIFQEPKHLIIIYKDNDGEAANQLRKRIQTNDDTDGKIIGTKDGSIEVVPWNEEYSIDNLKDGTKQDNLLFLDGVKEIQNLESTLTIRFDQYGVKYGFSGKRAAIIVDTKALIKEEEYKKFLNDLRNICDSSTVNEEKYYFKFDKNDKRNIFEVISFVLCPAFGAGLTLSHVHNNKELVRKQQLLYGVSRLYIEFLEEFMTQ